MYTKKIISYFTLFLGVLVCACTAGNDQTDDPDKNLYESAERGNRASELEYSNSISVGEENLLSTIENYDMLSRLYEAARASGVFEELEHEGPYTVLAPANIAFEKAKNGETGDVSDNWSKEELKEILASHIVKGSYQSSGLTDAVSLESINGKQIKMNGKEHLLYTDIEANNGIIHIIDTILVYPN